MSNHGLSVVQNSGGYKIVRRKPVESERNISHNSDWRPIQPVCDEIICDFSRGLEPRQLAMKFKKVPQGVIHGVIRDFVRSARWNKRAA